MDDMRADMEGAACVVATLYAASRLKLSVNLVGKLSSSTDMQQLKHG
jgi:leucyl aminopeptidase